MTPAPLRRVDIRPLPDDPGHFLVVDPLELRAEALTVPAVFLLVAQHFDGVRTTQDIADRLRTEGLDILPQAIGHVAKQLGDCLLLADNAAQTKIQDLETRALGTSRPARLAGKCYPESGSEAAKWLDDLLASAGSPLPPTGAIGGLVLPHIDLRLGGPTYAQGYRNLLAAPPADVYVVLGIGHAGLQHGISLAPVDFETPLGIVPVDSEICQELTSRLGDWLLADQMVQRREHSVEFQALFLRHLAQGPFTMVPMLTSFGPQDTARMRPILQTLGTVLRESGKRAVVVASVDFSHVGPMYGDAQPASARMAGVEERDREAIAHLESADGEAFWRSVHADGNSTRICGYSSMWSMLELVEPRSGRLLAYDQTVMDAKDSRVTFAAMSFPA